MAEHPNASTEAASKATGDYRSARKSAAESVRACLIDTDTPHTAVAVFEEALADERRATVERIRDVAESKTYAAWDGISDAPAVIFEDLLAILDEEVAR